MAQPIGSSRARESTVAISIERDGSSGLPAEQPRYDGPQFSLRGERWPLSSAVGID